MTASETFTRRHPVLTYYGLMFAVSWGGFLLVGGSGILAGTPWQTDPRFQMAVLAMLAGPPVAGILMTLLISGTKGLRELLSRLLRWRVGGRCYAFALLTAPIVQGGVLLALSLFSPDFLPAIVTKDEKIALVASGIAVGLVGGLVEELGWTGFVIPRLRIRNGVLATGLVVGALWGVWHLLQMFWVGSTSADDISPALFLSQYFISAIAQLTAYRVLMVGVYARTESLLLAILMHASLIFSTLFVLAPPTTGGNFLVYTWTFTAVLWIVVAVVGTINRAHVGERTVGAVR